MLDLATDILNALASAASDAAGDAEPMAHGGGAWDEWKQLNFWTIPVGAFIAFNLGWLWYSRFLFGKPWLRLGGRKPEELGNPAKPMTISFISLLAMAAGMLAVHKFIGFLGVLDGPLFACGIWLAFIATTMGTTYAFHGKPFWLWAIDSSYQLVCLVIMGLIVAVWEHPGSLKFVP